MRTLTPEEDRRTLDAHQGLLLLQGVHPKIVPERLGHANIQITLDTYSHLLPGLQQAAAERFSPGRMLALGLCDGVEGW